MQIHLHVHQVLHLLKIKVKALESGQELEFLIGQESLTGNKWLIDLIGHGCPVSRVLQVIAVDPSSAISLSSQQVTAVVFQLLVVIWSPVALNQVVTMILMKMNLDSRLLRIDSMLISTNVPCKMIFVF